ncbi:hypothetical protein QFC19_000645 [Naganishia cerealis]|uniref:Uncharacterized protein n=1 Tax=Naganishia cerealis TaxID=610337 RepID=A0ACC2WMU1_9TREE|nr:hypothetical protein QFC19_000645 [Naganishia cerealis]
MPSIRARLAAAAIGWKYSDRKHASEQGILDGVRDSWARETSDEVVPTSAEERFASKGSDEKWQVFHIRPRTEPVQVGKVVVYFHGDTSPRRLETNAPFLRNRSLYSPSEHLGAPLSDTSLTLSSPPCAQMQDRHWIFIQKLADELKCDVIVPIYTLAPLATGTSCIQTCIELLAHLERDDVRYRGKQFVLCGDSAGGWIALRVLLALIERYTGKVTFRDRHDKVHVSDIKLKQPEDFDYKAILDSVSDVLMISPVVDANDPWLSKNIIDVAGRLWSYGPSLAYPSFDFGVPEERKALPIEHDEKTGSLPDLDQPAFSPVNGLDILHEYKACLEKVKFTTFIGTHDILYPQNVRMQERLETLGANSDLHVYEGLFHVFPLLPWLPESMDAFEKIRKLF